MKREGFLKFFILDRSSPSDSRWERLLERYLENWCLRKMLHGTERLLPGMFIISSASKEILTFSCVRKKKNGQKGVNQSTSGASTEIIIDVP